MREFLLKASIKDVEKFIVTRNLESTNIKYFYVRNQLYEKAALARDLETGRHVICKREKIFKRWLIVEKCFTFENTSIY